MLILAGFTMDKQSLVELEKAVAAAVGASGTEEQARAILRGVKMALEEAAAIGESPPLLRSLERFLAQRRSDHTSTAPAPGLAVGVQPGGGDSSISAALKDLAIN